MKNYIMVALAALLFAGCSSSKTGTDQNTLDLLKAKNWQVTEINNVPVPINLAKIPFLRFTSETVLSGNAGCNQYGGRYILTGTDQISFSNMFSTKMACDDLQTENAYFQALNSSNRFVVTADALTFFNGTTEMLQYRATDL